MYLDTAAWEAHLSGEELAAIFTLKAETFA
jgi:hypothetical protein